MIVNLKHTVITGVEKVCRLNGAPYYSYLGIPYAKPPIGNLRFQPPQEPDKLEEEFDATLEGDDCIQLSRVKVGTTGSEDCLYVNVHVPKTENNDKLKPVLVYVHGGAYTYFSGSSTYFSPDYLLPYDIIVVTMNFRLHILGFLNLGISECPGNVGMKDQVMAFRWIKENIGYFGGDPNNVTAYGSSTGAAMLHMHTMSPLCKDEKLFHRLILQSGNASTVEVCRNPIDRAFDFGHQLGFRGKTPEALLKYLRNIPADELVEAVYNYQKYLEMENGGNIFWFPFHSSVETIQEGAFLPDLPSELSKHAVSYPTITGIVSKEGILAYYIDPFVINHLREDFTSCIKRIIHMDESIAAEVADMIKLFYYKNKELDITTVPETVNLYTDLYWLRTLYDVHEANKQSPQKYPTYTFHFTYDGPLNCYKKYYPVLTRLIDGPTHEDLLGYVLPFKSDLASKFSSKRDIKIINHVCTFWTNFVKTGNPNGDNINVIWKPSTEENPCFLEISENTKLIEGRINEERLKFWKNIQKIVKEGKIEESVGENY